MEQKDPYEILGVSRTATPDEIKRAYRRLAKAHHPDRNPNDPSAETRFKEVQAAYEVLGDPQRRAEYDRFGAGGPAPEFRTWQGHDRRPVDDEAFDFGSFGDLNQIFEQFFRRPGRAGPGRAAAPGRNGGRRARGPDIEYSVQLSFEDALNGTTREIVLTGGEDDSERIEFRIPPGVVDGQRIRLRGKGQPGPGGRGDLMIVCQVMPHAYFRREGRDILVDLPLSFAEAALGAIVEVPSPSGPLRVRVPPGASGGARLRVRGKGVPGPRGEAAGDLFAVVRIVVPREISPTARQLIEQLERELKEQPRAEAPWAR